MDVMVARPAAIRAVGLDVRYADAHALRDVDLSIEQGSFVLIGGRSGSGKSTLGQALLGLLSEADRPGAPRVRGHIAVEGMEVGMHSTAELASRVGLVFQNPATQLFNGTVQEEVAFGPHNLGLSEEEIARRVSYGLRAVGAEHLRARAVRRLSGGEQQRVAIAASLAMQPSILILDEPTANLDAEGATSVVRSLAGLHRERGITIIVIEHRFEPFLECAERLIWLDEGRVTADGVPNDVLARVGIPALRGAPRVASSRPLVSLEGVTVGYNGRPVLRECSLTLREGELGALVGANGSGKSTLGRTLSGLIRPWQGRIVWYSRRRAAGRVGFLQQNPLHQLVCPTVEREIDFAPRNLRLGGGSRREKLLTWMGLDGLRQRPTQALSVGEQQRTALAATLSIEPQLLILDEPTLGQDRYHLWQMMSLVRELNERGQTVLLITHDRALVEHLAGRVWQMVEGQACERER